MRSHVGGYFFLSSLPVDEHPSFSNENIHITCVILKLITITATEAKLGAPFLNTRKA